MLQRAFWLCLLASVCEAASLAQSPYRGVVWESNSAPTVEDLRLMRHAGVQAVRLPLVSSPQLLAAADSLELSLFQELPMRYLSAAGLMDSLESASARLLTALMLGAGHTSAEHFGLAFYSDTSNEKACLYFADLARAADAVSDARLYYVSPFIQSDRCAAAVDFVLLDLRHVQDPSGAVAQWPLTVPVGVGAVGTYVLDGAFGLKHSRSPQSQARYFENHLPALLKASMHATFVYLWQDAAEPTHAHKWGILDSLGQSRPAYQVVRGLYTETQTVFAFPAGTPAPSSTPWLVILGWLAIFALGCTYAVSVRWRNLAHRFIARHGFYLDSVKMGRELPGAGCLMFMLVQALITGCVLWLALEAALETRAGEPMLASLAPAVMEVATIVTAGPRQAIAVFGGLYLAYQLLLLLTGMAVHKLRRLSDLKRAFTIQVSAQWHSICLLPLIMVSPSFAQTDLPLMAGLTAAAWILVQLHSGIRLVADYASILPPSRKLAALSLVVPQVLTVTGAFLWAMYTPLGASIGFWWHLILRA